MEITKKDIHATLGRISIMFANLEHELHEVIVNTSFKGDWVQASAVIEDHTLNKNLQSIQKISKGLNETLENRLIKLVKEIDQLRIKRNMFIHGQWHLNHDSSEDKSITVTDLRTKFKREKRRKTWSRGTTTEFSFDDLRTIEVQIMSALQQAYDINEKLVELSEDDF